MNRLLIPVAVAVVVALIPIAADRLDRRRAGRDRTRVSGTWLDADGRPARGSVVLTLSRQLGHEDEPPGVLDLDGAGGIRHHIPTPRENP